MTLILMTLILLKGRVFEPRLNDRRLADSLIDYFPQSRYAAQITDRRAPNAL